MSRFCSLRLLIPALLAAALLPAAVHAQADSSQSVAEAAKRAREQKKTATKPVKVVTEDDVKPASVDSAAAPAQPATPAQPNPSGAQDAKEAEKNAKQRAALKEQIKQAESDIDLLQRQLRLDQDSYYSKVDYAKDAAGKEKLDAEKQQISDKQQDLDQLKAQLAALPDSPEPPAPAPPTP